MAKEGTAMHNAYRLESDRITTAFRSLRAVRSGYAHAVWRKHVAAQTGGLPSAMACLG